MHIFRILIYFPSRVTLIRVEIFRKWHSIVEKGGGGRGLLSLWSLPDKS